MRARTATRSPTIEPGGAEYIPLSERHGKPQQQFWTWVSPNMEFATIFVGVIGVWFFGQSFWMAALAIVLGTALGSLSMGALAARGPLFGVPQMVLSRIGFGFLGNILPAGINALVAGVGWFAVNSVSGAFALNALLGWNDKICLLIIVVVAAGGRVLRAQPGARVRALGVPGPGGGLRHRLGRDPSQGAPGRARGRRSSAAG